MWNYLLKVQILYNLALANLSQVDVFYYSCFTDEEIETYLSNLLESKQQGIIRARI